MNIYDMMKSGKSQEEIFEAFKQECAGAKEQMAKEEAAAREAEAQTKANEAKLCLLSEARAHLINAILAYSNAFLPEQKYTEEEIKELDAMLQASESEIETMFKLSKSLSTMFDVFGGKAVQEEKSRPTIRMAANIDDEEIRKALRKFIEGLK